MTMDKLVSIVIPTYYRDERLKRAIESALNQTYESIEIVVVDDSGEEYAKDIVSRHNIKYIAHNENRGGNAARNTGIERSDGRYIQLLDDDDVILPEKISKQVKLLESAPEARVGYAGIKQRSGQEFRPVHSGNVLKHALEINLPCSHTSSLLIEANILEKIVPLKNRGAADDIGMKIELAQETDFEFVDEVLTKLGNSDQHRSEKIEFSNEIENIINEYNHLYNQYPETVRNQALASMYAGRGRAILNSDSWSLQAIKCYGLAMHYERDEKLKRAVAFLASIFGRPGLNIALQLADH